MLNNIVCDRDVVLESRTWTRVQFLGLGLGLATYMDMDMTHPDLNLIFKVFLHFSLMENPDSQSQILNHLL